MASANTMDFKCALVTGGAGGIGKTLSQHLIKRGKKVILAGRTESKLQQTAKEIGAAAYYVLDTGITADIGPFIERITREHPELDCLINNAAVQKPLDVMQMEAGDLLATADSEIDINIRGPMYLAVGLLPHLLNKQHALVANVTSLLGYIPFETGNPVYNATKAFMHSWTLNLRKQLEGTRVVVAELAPPMVESDLHRDKANPDDNKKFNNPIAMGVEEYVGETLRRLDGGELTIGAGMAKDPVEKWFEAFGARLR